MAGPPFVQNDLNPVSLDEKSLQYTLRTLQSAIARASTLLADLSEQIPDELEAYSSKIAHVYSGDAGMQHCTSFLSIFYIFNLFHLGIALMFLRLSVQYDAAGLGSHFPSTFRAKVPAIISRLLPDPGTRLNGLKHGRLSPLDSSSGPAFMYVLASLSFPAMDFGHGVMTERNAWHAAIKTLRTARRFAVEDESLGGDEVLYGRAGLLWALINLRSWLKSDTRGVDGYRREDLQKVVGESIETLVESILVTGNTGAMLYERGHNGISLPLMWEWQGKHYLGA